jgi:g-D-glutamyl-meso-diaminopimelate peptidase
LNGHIVQVVDNYSYDRMRNDLIRLSEVYPFIRLSYIGESELGKPIPAVQVGTGTTRVHYNAAIHANEWITSLLLMVFLEEYAEAVRTGTCLFNRNAVEIFEQSMLYMVPMVNPDGVDLVHYGTDINHPFHNLLLQWNEGSADFSQWKANIRGVDLNDQFPAHWAQERLRRSTDGPGPRDYAGEQPLSESEARTMAEFTRRNDFHLVVALHTQGKEIYWNYRDYEPVEAYMIAEQFAAISGYEAIKLTDSDAGYKDWFIQKFRRPGFTVEAGLGCNPLPISEFNCLYEEVLPILVRGLSILGD